MEMQLNVLGAAIEVSFASAKFSNMTNAEQRRTASSFRLTNILYLLIISSCIHQ